jgi:hypothetical protein
LEGLLNALEASALASTLRVSRWGYAALSASHILALAMLVGATLPLNLRLLGLWPRIEVATLARVLVPVAATGLGLAILTGLALFSVRAGEYEALTVLQAKLALVTLGGAAALWAHVRYGWTLAAAPPAARYRHAALSLACWIGALACGRLIAFMG